MSSTEVMHAAKHGKHTRQTPVGPRAPHGLTLPEGGGTMTRDEYDAQRPPAPQPDPIPDLPVGMWRCGTRVLLVSGPDHVREYVACPTCDGHHKHGVGVCSTCDGWGAVTP